jgi:hypothetical protein
VTAELEWLGEDMPVAVLDGEVEAGRVVDAEWLTDADATARENDRLTVASPLAECVFVFVGSRVGVSLLEACATEDVTETLRLSDTLDVPERVRVSDGEPTADSEWLYVADR